MNLVDRSAGLNNLLDIIHAIDTVKYFIQEMINGSHVTIDPNIDTQIMSLSELLAPKDEEESPEVTEEVTEDITETSVMQETENASETAIDDTQTEGPVHIEGKLGVDIDLEPEIDPELKESEIYKEWDSAYKEAVGILAMYNDYCTNAYEASKTCFMSIGYLRYIEYYKMLLEVYLKLEGIALSKYNTNEAFKFIIKARNVLLHCTNDVSVVVEIINEVFDKELEINRFYYEDIDHWMKDEFPDIICKKFDTANDAANKLEEMIQLLYKINSLIYKLDQLKFEKMRGCFDMIREGIKQCETLYKDYIDYQYSV